MDCVARMTDIAAEKAVIDSAPPLHLEELPFVGRCHFCGQPARQLQIVEALQFEGGGQHIRYKGECCGSNSNREQK